MLKGLRTAGQKGMLLDQMTLRGEACAAGWQSCVHVLISPQTDTLLSFGMDWGQGDVLPNRQPHRWLAGWLAGWPGSHGVEGRGLRMKVVSNVCKAQCFILNLRQSNYHKLAIHTKAVTLICAFTALVIVVFTGKQEDTRGDTNSLAPEGRRRQICWHAIIHFFFKMNKQTTNDHLLSGSKLLMKFGT